MRARYYDPTTGRFISKDPIDGSRIDPQTQNGYNFANANPINLSDPSGNSVNVYGGFDASGALRYVGQTCRDVAVRAQEHLNSLDPQKQLIYEKLYTVPDLLTARGSEQSYIDTYGLSKNGGQLINQINSVSSSNPVLDQAKNQAQLSGAVPAVSATVGQVITSALGSFPLILMVNPNMYNPSNTQPVQL